MSLVLCQSHPPSICSLACSVATLTPKQESTIYFIVGKQHRAASFITRSCFTSPRQSTGQTQLGQELVAAFAPGEKGFINPWQGSLWRTKNHSQKHCNQACVSQTNSQTRLKATCRITYAYAKFKISGQILALGSIGTRWKEGRPCGKERLCSLFVFLLQFPVPAFHGRSRIGTQRARLPSGRIHFLQATRMEESHLLKFWRCRSQRQATILSNAPPISTPPRRCFYSLRSLHQYTSTFNIITVPASLAQPSDKE